MELNFYPETKHSYYKFLRYKIEKINEKDYIVPERSNFKPDFFSIEDVLEKALVDLLNIGKILFDGDQIKNEQVIEFVNQYGILGFMNDFPINRYYIFDDIVILKDYNYIFHKDSVADIAIGDYLKIFMPQTEEKRIREMIQEVRNIKLSGVMEKYLTPEINKHLIYSNEYCEPLDMFLDYAKYMYELLDAIQKDDKTKVYSYMDQFEVNHLRYTLNQIDEDTKVEFKINYLKQVMDYIFSTIVARDVNLLKICKFCGKAFIASNPKAEYDSYLCKNKANVYKSRERNKEE